MIMMKSLLFVFSFLLAGFGSHAQIAASDFATTWKTNIGIEKQLNLTLYEPVNCGGFRRSKQLWIVKVGKSTQRAKLT